MESTYIGSQTGQQPEENKPTLRQRLLERMDNKLYQRSLRSNPKTLKRRSLVHVTAFILASLVYLGFIAVVGLATTLIVTSGIFAIRVGMVALIMVSIWIIWPRFMDFPPAEVIADRDDFPALDELVAELAFLLNVKKPTVVLTEHFDAAFGRIGFRRRPVLLLGHPLLSMLSEAELVTVIAHELGHSRDGAATRSLFIRVAHSAVRRMTRMSGFRNSADEWKPLSLLPFLLLLLPAQLLLRFIDWLFALCAARDAQRAEYLADKLSLAIAGQIDMVQLNNKFNVGLLKPVQQAYTSAIPLHRYAVVRNSVGQVRSAEFERLNEYIDQQPRSLLAWHPSTAHRLAFLDAAAPVEPRYILRQHLFDNIQFELKRWPVIITERERVALPKIDESVELSAEGLQPTSVSFD